MMKRLLPLLLVLTPFMVAGLCSDDDGGSNGTDPTDDLALMQACAVEGLVDYGLILEGLWHVLKETDQPASYTPPFGVNINLPAGTYEAELDWPGSTNSVYLDGTIEPDSLCADGMQQGDVCVFEWTVHIPISADTLAIGTYSAIDMGLTLPPNQTTAIRYTISRRNTALLASDECGLTVDGFDWMLRPWDEVTPVTSAMIYFDVITPHGIMDGSIIGGAADSVANLTLTFGSQSQQCAVNLQTWSVDCS